MQWSTPRRPVNYAEEALLTAILDGTFPTGSTLPAERELSGRLGITRPTLREALGRLERDGWLTIRQGKPTRVNEFWREGGLNVLSALVRYCRNLPQDFVPNLLQVRLVIAPAYTRQAVERAPEGVSGFFEGYADLEERPEAFASFDWQLHHHLTVSSGNPVYTLILNGFAGFYEAMARRYFEWEAARASSRDFYAGLSGAARNRDANEAERITRAVMLESVSLWEGALQRAF